MKFGIDMYLAIFKMDNQQVPTCWLAQKTLLNVMW